MRVCLPQGAGKHLDLYITVSHRSAAQLSFANEAAAEHSKEHDSCHENKSFVDGPAVAAPHNPGDLWVKGLNEFEALANAVDDFIDVLAAIQSGSQSFSQELLDDGRRKGQPDHGSQ